ncbi:MAG: PIG-L family deacetylase [Stackebrandtia sp.]
MNTVPACVGSDRVTVSRRTVLLGALSAATAAACTSDEGTPVDDVGAPGEATHLQIMAHPDDDLFFYNLDVARAIQDRHTVVTLCLTAGESNGKNAQKSDPDFDDMEADFLGFAAARFTGLRSAYAEMASGDPDHPWERQALEFDNGIKVEKAVLQDYPYITLLHYRLWENSDQSQESYSGRLSDLWSGEVSKLATMRLPGGAVDTAAAVTHENLLGTLVETLKLYKPTVVRTMDLDPDPQEHDDDNPQYADQDGYSDHIDHTYAALYTWEALNKWLPEQSSPVHVVGYRGYYNQRWPRNLSEEARAEKGRYLDTYAWADERNCGEPDGCGDRKLPGDGVGDRYGASTIQRFPGSLPVLRTDGEGRLHALTAVNGRLTVWSEKDPGGSVWGQTHFTDRPVWFPNVTAVPDGVETLLAAGLEQELGPAKSDHVRDVSLAVIPIADFSETKFHVLDNPDSSSSEEERVRGLGSPEIVVLPDGTRMLFARTFDRTVAARIQRPDEDWTDWIDLGGHGIQDGLSATVDGGDSATVFAAAADGVRYWTVSSSGEHSSSLIPVDPPASPPTVATTRDGAAALLVRQAHTAAIVMYRRSGADSEWNTTPVELGGNGGGGRIEAITMRAWESAIAVAHVDDSAQLSFGVTDFLADDPRIDWRRSGPRVLRPPGLTVDRDSLVAVAAVGADGKLHVARQAAVGDGHLGDWMTVAVPS